MPNQGLTQAREPIMVEVEGFPFFANDFRYDVEMETDYKHAGIAGSGKVVTTGRTITGSIELGGHFIAEEIQPILRSERGIPEKVEIEVTMMESKESVLFDEAFCSNDNKMRAKMASLGDPISLDFVATDVTHEKSA